MKKVLSIILSGALLASCAMLTSCGGGDSGTLTMATNAQFPPYEYYEGDKVVGIDAEIAEAIATKLGKTLEIADIEFNSIIAGVQTGKYDIGIAGITVTDERKESVAFTDSYATGVQSVIVKEDSPITSPADLGADGATYTIGVQLSTTGDIYASDEFGEDRVQKFQTGADAVNALKADKVDCVIIDNQPANSYVTQNQGLKVLDTEYAVEEYAICTSKDNSELLNDINAALAELKADGTIDGIIAKYISAE